MTVFFILGMGRSGSTFMAEMLVQARNGFVIHETPEDREVCVEGYWHPNKSLSMKRVMAISRKESMFDVYGEVSSYLRYHPLFLQHAFNAKIFHLVRDGRKVVRSMMNRTPYTEKDRNHSDRITPKLDDKYYYRWNKFSRFQKICWYWNNTVENLLRYRIPVLKFEEILKNYNYLKEYFLDKVGLDLPEYIWQSEIDIIRNKNKSYQFPEYEYWNTSQKIQFEEICGGVMNVLGY